MPATVTILVSQQGSGSAVADVKKDLGDLGSSAKDAGGGFSIMGEIATGALRAIGEAAFNAAVGGLKALGGAVMDGIADARTSAKLYASTEQTIKTMGNAAGVSAKHVVDMASALSDASGKSLFGDDQIQQSSNLLLTFGEIKGATLDTASALTVDLAQALGGEPKDQAMMLGKALNNPTKGLAALGKAGLTFSEDQKDMIKALQEGGHMAEAQAIILEELNKQVGGQAEAAAKAAGGMVQFKARMGETKEMIGAALLPILDTLGGFLNTTLAPAIEDAAKAFTTWLANPATQAGIKAITDAIMTGIGGAFSWLTGTAIPALITGWGLLVSAAAPVIEGLHNVYNGIKYLIDFLTGVLDAGTFQNYLDGIFPPAVTAAIMGALSLLLGAFQYLVNAFTDAKTPVEGFINVLSIISPTFALLRSVVETSLPAIQSIVMTVFGIISGFIQEHGAKIQADLTAAWQAIQGLIAALLPPIQAIVSAVFGAIATFLAAHGEEIKLFLGQTWDTVAQIVILAVQLIQAIIVPIFTAIAAFLQTHGTEIQAILGGAWTMITSIITGALELIKGIITAVMLAIKGDWAGAWEAIKTMCANVVLAILGVIRGFLTIAETLFSEAWQKILSDATASFNAIKALFIFVWTEIKVFFQGILDGMVGWVLQTLQGIINAISSFAGQAQSAAGRVGDAIVSGIASGIESGASAIINAAKDAAMDALNAAKSALGIGSPSKLFASEIGKPMAQGMAAGLVAHAPMVAGAAQYAAGAALEGGSSVADSYNRSVSMNITNNLSGTEGMDYSLAASLAGV